jgi:ketosteroid isomerase-like protein
MGIAENKKTAEAETLNTRPQTLAERLSYYAENATVWDSVMKVLGYRQDNRAVGFPEVKKFLTWLSNLPPVKVKITNIFGEGDKVAVEWILSGGEGAKKFEIPCANIYDFKNGKITGVRMHFDSFSFAEIVKGS